MFSSCLIKKISVLQKPVQSVEMTEVPNDAGSRPLQEGSRLCSRKKLGGMNYVEGGIHRSLRLANHVKSCIVKERQIEDSDCIT